MAIKKFSLFLVFLGVMGVFSFYAGLLSASDPPHTETSDTGWCGKCHTPHSQLNVNVGGAGVPLGRVEGIANLCISCHNTGGRATNKPFISYDQAVLGAEPAGGWSHRWDSGVGGYVDNYSVSSGTTGRVVSGIVGGIAYAFTYTTPRIYEINVATTGNVGVATFRWRWSQDRGALWSGYSTGTLMTTAGIPLDTIATGDKYGSIKVSFLNGTFPSFAGSNDVFRVYVRPDISYPQNSAIRLSSRMVKDPYAPTTDTNDSGGDSYRKATCTACHDQHKQSKTTSDPTSNQTYTPGVTNDRHFQRINNISDATCRDCHRVRDTTDVRTYTGNNLSHPVGISIAAGNTPMHAVPYEAVGATTVQTQYSYRGDVTGGAGTVTSLTDSTKSFVGDQVANKIVRFTTGVSKNTTRVVSNTSSGNTLAWTTATTIALTDKYEIDADGNLSNSLRLYNSTSGLPSFTTGQVLCLSCHSIHWGDSDEATADVP